MRYKSYSQGDESVNDIKELLKDLKDLRFRLGTYEKVQDEDWKIVDNTIETMSALYENQKRHIVAEGDFPPENMYVLAFYDDETCAPPEVLHYNQGCEGIVVRGFYFDQRRMDNVVAWQMLPEGYRK